MNFSIVVCQFEGYPVHVHLVILASALRDVYVSCPIYNKEEMMDEVRRQMELGFLVEDSWREAVAQRERWPIPPVSGRTFPDKPYWAMFLGYKRGHPLGLAGEPLRCQFVHWLGEGGAEYAVFRPLPREEDRAPVSDTPCPT